MEPAQIEDSSLVRQTLDGSQEAFQTLVERYQTRLFALARHYTKSSVDIEDIVQEAFLKAYSRLDTFQHQSSFYTWLYRITTNTVLDFMKRHGRNPVQAVEDPELAGEGASSADPGSSRAISPHARLETQEISEITRAVLDELPEIFRTVLVLREFESLPYQEIADVLDISIGTVESRLFRARARFKDKLMAMYPEFGGEV